jgi:hypothetical protein
VVGSVIVLCRTKERFRFNFGGSSMRESVPKIK